MQKLKGIKILLVDDEPNILQFLEMGLQDEGFDVQTAQDGMTAVTLAKQFQPHIVILDVMMPGMDGMFIFSGLIYLAGMLLSTMATAAVIAGWNLVMAMQLVLTGIILMMMGILGEYIGRIYDETRNRPLYIVSECYGMMKKERKVKKVV